MIIPIVLLIEDILFLIPQIYYKITLHNVLLKNKIWFEFTNHLIIEKLIIKLSLLASYLKTNLNKIKNYFIPSSKFESLF